MPYTKALYVVISSNTGETVARVMASSEHAAKLAASKLLGKVDWTKHYALLIA